MTNSKKREEALLNDLKINVVSHLESNFGLQHTDNYNANHTETDQKASNKTTDAVSQNYLGGLGWKGNIVLCGLTSLVLK